MRSITILLAILLSIAAVNAQYQWTVDSWGYDVDANNDYETLAYITPISPYDFDEDFETYGGKSSGLQYAQVSPLQAKTLAPKFETIPETYNAPIYAAEVVNTQLIDQPIKAPRVIRQPIVQQRIVEQPIYRTRVINQPIIRRIVNQPIVRPHITKTSTTKPMYSEQQILQPKIYEQNVIRQSYSEKQENRNPIVEAPTHYSAKGGDYAKGGEYTTMWF